MKKFLFFLLLFQCTFAFGQHNEHATPLNRTERIINFHSDILIDTTGKISVSETITVYAAGNEIKRGIVRSLPVYRTNKYGKQLKVSLKIVSVSCNGVRENYRIERNGKYKEVYIGKSKVFLEPGIYEYVITYESRGQVGFFDTFDELYWNVTGNDWKFYIEKASASITLPKNVESINTACYTGAYGSTAMNCSAETTGNSVFFETEDQLIYGEGLTVAVSFPRDIVKRPTESEIFWAKNINFFAAILCLLIFGIFFFFTWLKVGKDPEKPIAIPTFKPPHDRSPAATSYLYKLRYDEKAFTAALVQMAVKKAIRISNNKLTFTLEAIERKENLSLEEKEIYDTLFSSSSSIKMSDSNYKQFSKARENMIKSLETNWNLKHYLIQNLKHVAWGAALMLVLIFSYFIVTEYVNLEIIGYKQNWVTAVFIPVILILYGIYVYLIKLPTALGIQTASELEGFKMYLKTAEEQFLNSITPPERTPELFERLLPYAIALGVENQWGEKFTKILKQFNYNPDWYVGSTPFSPVLFSATNSYSFTSSVGSSFGSASSGSSGGGFSGGGGGGGGGGGW
ncbi:MAG: DUF2207 domain-containing protein [Lentimicrobiaceae bacterium]|nr:DUF2207 domain-containing protein [Lentimicrobiaceae bacterium]